MGQLSNQPSAARLQEYLGQLPPKAQALLMREFERSIERGENLAVAHFVLDQLRSVVRQADDQGERRVNDPGREFFRVLEPFLASAAPVMAPAQIRRSSLSPIWQWLTNEAIPAELSEFKSAFALARDDAKACERAVRSAQLAAAEAIAKLVSENDRRVPGRLGAPGVMEDIALVAAVFESREALEALRLRMPSFIRVLEEGQLVSVSSALNVPLLQRPQTLPFALATVMSFLASPWQIIRVAVRFVGSDDELKIAATPFAIAVTAAISGLSQVSGDLRNDIKRGQFANIPHHLKTLHDGVRGLRTELDLRQDSTWGKRLAALRAEISRALQAEIERVPGRVRRLLRQRSEKDAAVEIDRAEVEETASLIEFVAACRTYAGELAINEVTLRTYSDLQTYIESATENLVESLRSGNAGTLSIKQAQARAAIRFCEVLFGPDYASLMSRAADMALAGERSARTA